MNTSSYASTNAGKRQAGKANPSADICDDTCEVDVIHLEAVRASRRGMPGDSEIMSASELLTLVSNATRLRMLFALRASAGQPRPELCVCDLTVVAEASKSMVSHQLRLLRTAHLVRHRKSGKLTYYRLVDGPVISLLEAIPSFAIRAQGAERPVRRRTKR